MNKRLGDILFIFITTFLFIPVSYCAYGLRGLAILTVAFFLPLYVIRIIIWASWSWLCPWLSAKLTPKSWTMLVFSVWASLGIFIWISASDLGSWQISFPTWIKILGFVLATAGVVLSLWAEWLLGLKTAILTTRIFDKESKEEQKLISTGPYALFAHPIFLGEWLIIFGCFLLTSWIFLLVLLLVAFFSDVFSARGEERDLRLRFGEEYRNYRSMFLFFIRRKREDIKQI